MDWGIQLPVQSQSRIYVEDWELGAGPDEIARAAKAAEEAGAYYVAVCDHTAIPRDLAPRMGTVWYDTFTTLGWVAAQTSRVRLLTHVYVLPTKHPLVVAKQAMTLDALSGGRVILGVGAGHVEREFEALGADFPDRGGALDEAIDSVRAALSSDWPSHHGKRWRFADVGVAPRPVQERVPVWIGGSSPPALRRAALKGDGWLPQGIPTPDQIREIRRVRRQAGVRDPIALGALCEPFYVGEPSWDVGKYTLSGSAERVAERIREFADMGCSHVQLRPRSRSVDEYCDQLAALGAEVAPSIAEVAH